jgi:hypothetical protein
MTVFKRAKTAIEVLLLAVIAAFVTAACLIVFVDLFYTAGPQPSDAFRGGFWGAFLAFIFVRVSEAMNRFYQAGKDHRKGLGQVQFRLNEALNISNDNLFVLEQWDAFYLKTKEVHRTKVVPVFTNRIEFAPSVKDALMDLGSIGLVNELFLLESDLRKLNDSLETWQRSYEVARSAFIAKDIDLATYLANVEQSNEHVQTLRKFVEGYMEDVIGALAATRLLTQYKPFLVKFYSWINPDRYSKAQDPNRDAEIQKLRSEVAQVGAESKKRIDGITGGSTTAGRVL